MLFFQPLVSFVVAFAAASSVAASATPVARTDYPPPSPSPVSQCNAPKTVQCCNTWTNANNPLVAIAKLIFNLDIGDIQGLGCTTSILGGNCNNDQLCCENNYQLIGVNCVKIL